MALTRSARSTAAQRRCSTSRYVLSELRRRRGRTLLTALGLGVGVGLVVTVSALSSGLDRAQDKVLEPLTGVGTDMSVTRPLKTGGGAPGFGNQGLSKGERDQVRKENGPRRFGLRSLGKPGEHFENDDFVTATQLSFPQTKAAKLAHLEGAKDAAAGLTVTAIHVSGTVPKNAAQAGPPAAGPPTGGPPNNVDLDSRTVTGIDSSKPTLAAISPSQISRGRYLRSGKAREAVLNSSYARRNGLGVGDTITLKKKKFEIVGLSKAPLGGQASDVYVKLDQLQKLAGREGRANVVYVRATSSGRGVRAQQADRELVLRRAGHDDQGSGRPGGRLAGRRQEPGRQARHGAPDRGSARRLPDRLPADPLVGDQADPGARHAEGHRLAAAAGGPPGRGRVASCRECSAVWRARRSGSPARWRSTPSAPRSQPPSPRPLRPRGRPAAPGAGPIVAAFGQGQVASGSTSISLDAPVDIGLVLLAIGLALLGGLLAGSVGGLRAARLRPADALRHIE